MVFFATDLIIVHDFAWLGLSATGVRFYVNYGVSALACFLWFRLLRDVLWRAWHTRVLGWALTLLPLLAQASHFAIYREMVAPLGFDFAAKNRGATFEFFWDTVDIWRCVLALAGGALSLIILGPAGSEHSVLGTAESGHSVLGRAQRSVAAFAAFRTAHFVRKSQNWLQSIVVAGLLIAGSAAWYSVTQFQNALFAFYAAWIEYSNVKLGLFNVTRPEISTPTAPPSKPLPHIIWVIGESASRLNMSLFGYTRQTTPNLDALHKSGRLVPLHNMMALGNKTLLSVPYMLFGLEGPDPRGRIYRTPNIFGYAKTRGYTTALISAQDLRWYNFDKLIVDKNIDVVRSGSDFATNVTISRGADDLTVVNKGIIPVLSKTGGHPLFLVYQMDGSHFPYGKHSPAAFKRFLPEETPTSLNAYDNSIAYTDHVLFHLFSQIQNVFPKDPVWIFFTSDHGQNTGLPGQKSRFHGGYSHQVLNVPAFVMPPSEALPQITKHSFAPLTQSDFFGTILDLMDLKPISPIQGLSLLGNIPSARIRITSEYMPTFSNNPSSAIVFPNFDMIRIDLKRLQLMDPSGEEPQGDFESLSPEALMLLKERL